MNHTQRLALCITGGVFCWAVAVTACTNQDPPPAIPTVTTVAPAASAALPATTSQPVVIRYNTCQDAADAGALPLTSGQPGYSTRLDRDRDGIACE